MKVNPKTREAYTLLHKGTFALARAERAGIRVDMDYLKSQGERLARRSLRLEEEFKKSSFYRRWEHSSKGKVNIYSDPQLRHYLYHTLKLEPPVLTATGEGSTNEEALIHLNIPELNALIEISKLKKTQDVLKGFEREQVEGYIHPFYNLHLVRTYRSSSDHPNFQNIPKRDEKMMQMCRGALYARPGHQLLEVDTSGMEVRIAACYHKDSTMLNYIKDPKSDMHGDMAKQLFIIPDLDKKKPSHAILRQAAKNGFVFPEFYGDYYKNCAINLACNWGKLPQGKWKEGQGIEMESGTLSDHLISKGIKSIDDYTEHVKEIETDFWTERFGEYSEWKERWYNIYKKYGYIDFLTGFRCSGMMGKNDVINYPVQGAAFHCLLWSFIRVDEIQRQEGWDSRLVGQIHDSMVIDTNPDEAEHVFKTIQRVMGEELPKAWPWIIVPIDVDAEITPVDESWANKDKFTLK